MSRWFEVDRRGLAEIAKRRGIAFIVTEPIQNAWDEATTRVDVALVAVDGVPKADLRVEDDSPDGFRDMADSYSMFRPSYKVADPKKRGRFNIGEKLLLAVADSAQIRSTTGDVRFGEKGRTHGRKKTNRGSILTARLRMTREELAEALAKTRTLIPPIPTFVNEVEVPVRSPLATGEFTVETEVQGEIGGFRSTYRKTEVRIYEPLDGEEPHIYEMGIPVCEVDVPWHVEVMQKVPLTLDRASVSYSFKLSITQKAVELGAALLTEEGARSGAVSSALVGMTDDVAVRTIVERRFGKAVVYDPSNPESNKLALDAGFKVVHGGELSKHAWTAVRRSGALKPAGRVFATGKVETSPDGQPPVPRDDWTPEMEKVAEYAGRFAEHTCDKSIAVEFFRIPGAEFGAMCGWGLIAFNLSSPGFGKMVRELDQEAIDAVLIHECAHFRASDHLTHEYHRECCRIGAKARSFEEALR